MTDNSKYRRRALQEAASRRKRAADGWRKMRANSDRARGLNGKEFTFVDASYSLKGIIRHVPRTVKGALAHSPLLRAAMWYDPKTIYEEESWYYHHLDDGKHGKHIQRITLRYDNDVIKIIFLVLRYIDDENNVI